MTALRLAGCRSESLLGYLKALGALRLTATQADTSARGSWDDAVFVLDTLLSEGALERFLLESYAPTPIFNPWNNGAGFEDKLTKARQLLQKVAQAKDKRWRPYQVALAFIEETYIRTGVRRQYRDAADKDWIDKAAKGTFLRDLRARCPEELLGWLDASVVIATEGLEFPYLFGSGGNDGHLDFSVNFIERALDVCGDLPIPDAPQLLRDSLQETAQARLLQGVAIGQFSPRHAGGTNATTGFDAMSLVNPWDYVLMMEGALLFAGSIGRRSDRAPGRPVFPFALRGIAGGYGSASIDEQVRGEMWLPVWEGRASLASVVDLLRKGRIDMPGSGERSVVRDAVVASDAATAVVTMGVPLGIRRLERTVFAQRNGLAFSASTIGSVKVGDGYDRGIAVISRDAAAWIDRVRRHTLGAGAREALDAFYDGLLAFPNVPPNRVARAYARQELLIALADLDRALARTRDSTLPKMPWLEGDVVGALDDGTVEHRAALAVASLAAGIRQAHTPAAERENDELRRTGDDPVDVLGNLLERRMRLDSGDSNAGWLRACCAVSTDDAATFLTFAERSPERKRFGRLLRAYWHIRLASAKLPIVTHDEVTPVAYAVLKIVFDNPKARDDRIVRLLYSGALARGLRLAVQRARTIRELPAPQQESRQAPRDVAAVALEDPAWFAAALALPIERSAGEYTKLLNSALLQRIPWNEHHLVGPYLATIA